MSYIPADASAAISKLTREALERSRFGRSGGRANTRAAAREATLELARRVRAGKNAKRKAWAVTLKLHGGASARVESNIKLLEANRRQLDRVAYGWRDGQRLQRDTAMVVANLLYCIDRKEGQECLRLVAGVPYWQEWSRVQVARGWLGPARPQELAQPPFELKKWATDEINSFMNWALDAGHHPARVYSAVARFVGPLCASHRTGGIERSWDDLTPREQRAAVRYGLGLERLWLGERPSHERRWTRALGGPPRGGVQT